MKRTRMLTALGLAGLMIRAAPAPTRPAPVAASADHPADATQGRLRFNQCVDGGPLVDVYVNGQVAVNGGVAQVKLAARTTNGYLYLAPGRYSVALAPSGQGLDHPFLGPLDVPVAAGHRYTVVALGQKEDPTHKALVIDETAAYQAINANPPDALHTAHITINNIKGVLAISWFMGGKVEENGVAYGDYQAALWPSGAPSFGLTLTGTTGVSPYQIDQTIANPPGADNMDGDLGAYPNVDSRTTPTTSLLNPIDFLHSYTALAATANGATPTFNTVLAALRTTGLAAKMANGSPYLLLAPTDAAFAALSKDRRDALLADPQALGALLRSYIVEGYYPPRSLSPNPADTAINCTVTKLLGAPLALVRNAGGLLVNGQAVKDGDTVFVANGTRLIEINKLYLPATPPTNPAPGMPSTGAGVHAAAAPVLLVVLALLVILRGGIIVGIGARRRSAQHNSATARGRS